MVKVKKVQNVTYNIVPYTLVSNIFLLVGPPYKYNLNLKLGHTTTQSITIISSNFLSESCHCISLESSSGLCEMKIFKIDKLKLFFYYKPIHFSIKHFFFLLVLLINTILTSNWDTLLLNILQ
jgi:hypothetical protein